MSSTMRLCGLTVILSSAELTVRPATVQVKTVWESGRLSKRAQKEARPRSEASTGLGALVKQISGSSTRGLCPPPNSTKHHRHY